MKKRKDNVVEEIKKTMKSYMIILFRILNQLLTFYLVILLNKIKIIIIGL